MKHTLVITAVAAASLVTGLSSAIAGGSPVGVWVDAKGRGAVEIKECGRKMLCGHIVSISNEKEQHGCGQQLIGEVRNVGGGSWDHGWIIDPDDRSKYDVALERVSRTELKVTGYMGSKLFSQEFVWKRARRSLKRCDEIEKKKETIIAARTTPPVSNGPRSAPNPARNPIVERYTIADITPPAPILAVRPAKFDVASNELSEAAREALEVMSISGQDRLETGFMALQGPPRRVAARQKTCRVLAPFVTMSFPCSR